MIFKSKIKFKKAEELADKLAGDLGLKAKGNKLFLRTNYFSSICWLDKDNAILLFAIPSSKEEFRVIGQKAKQLPYIELCHVF